MNYSWGQRTENDRGCEGAVGTENQVSMQCQVIVVREVWCWLCSVKHYCTEMTGGHCGVGSSPGRKNCAQCRLGSNYGKGKVGITMECGVL